MDNAKNVNTIFVHFLRITITVLYFCLVRIKGVPQQFNLIKLG